MKLNYFLHRFKQFVNVQDENIKDKDILDFWKSFSYTSRFSGQRQGKSKINYQRYISDNEILSKFQVDLITYTFEQKQYIYVLLAVDQVSKFCFYAFMKRKKESDLIQGFKTILNKGRCQKHIDLLIMYFLSLYIKF